EAGAEVREDFTVDEIVFDDGRVTGIRGHSPAGEAITERATFVVGADGWQSRLAEAVRADRYHEKPPLLAAYYSYWSGLPVDGLEVYIRPNRGFGAVRTHDDLTLIIGGWPAAEFESNKR